MNALPLLLAGLLGADAVLPTISEATKNADGFSVHTVRSAYHSGTTQIRMLLPKGKPPGKGWPVVYVLPVEAGTESKYGDGLREVKKKDLANKHAAVFVAPTFSQLPWYADHPTKPEVRQESYFVNVVLPFVEKTYPVQAGRDGRLLLGFSKSGWGAFSLMLRHPDTFGKAAAWDAPLMMDKPNRYGSTPIFGTQENFDRYQFRKLLPANAEKFRTSTRLILHGYGNFRGEHEQAHALMNDWKVKHAYRDGPSRAHDWHSGWVEELVEELLPGSR